ncbi:hypothetical protein IED13_17020 [Bosea sp. SSUT16]|uniref:Phosphoadenosine phosphosulphate reductase domain-containing protein n=1 Tax=Bosea spartocytisi TaxID=2773451 RepID=A0A927I1H9_9HYPH|nr:hypothetical protein [Bosea spartocytisi]MBD3847407.1 hypothetical protein [Bosea spartocytisi]
MRAAAIAKRKGFEPAPAPLRSRYKSRPIASTPAIAELLRQHAPVAIGVSGGKDSQAAAIATFEYLDRVGHIGPRLALHPAYRQFGMTRVSCRFCIMSSLADLKAASCQTKAHELYRTMVDLECRSSFAFQGARWLGDIAPHLLDHDARDALVLAKKTAARRIAAERRISRPMRFVKGWPTRMLSDTEADLLAEVRAEISGLLQLNARFLDRDGIHGRYAELLAVKASKSRSA